MAERCMCSRLQTGSLISATSFHPDYNPMIRKLESIFTLTDDERQALETLPMQVNPHDPLLTADARCDGL